VRDRSLLTFWTRFRPNTFYQSDTRLPELAFDQVRHPLAKPFPQREPGWVGIGPAGDPMDFPRLQGIEHRALGVD